MSESTCTEDYQNIFHWADTQKDGAVPSFKLRKNDPYKVRLHCPGPSCIWFTNVPQYQSGFGNM